MKSLLLREAFLGLSLAKLQKKLLPQSFFLCFFYHGIKNYRNRFQIILTSEIILAPTAALSFSHNRVRNMDKSARKAALDILTTSV